MIKQSQQGSLPSSSLADLGVWINLIRGREDQSAGVREALVESSTLINTVFLHLGYVCVIKLLECIKSIKPIQVNYQTTQLCPLFPYLAALVRITNHQNLAH